MASLFYLVPPATAVEAWWLFDEKLGWLAIVGMLVANLGSQWLFNDPRVHQRLVRVRLESFPVRFPRLNWACHCPMADQPDEL